jgi:hypothetical protein
MDRVSVKDRRGRRWEGVVVDVRQRTQNKVDVPQLKGVTQLLSIVEGYSSERTFILSDSK